MWHYVCSLALNKGGRLRLGFLLFAVFLVGYFRPFLFHELKGSSMKNKMDDLSFRQY